MSRWRELMKAGDFAEAEAEMLAETARETGYGYETIDRAGFYENWGDRLAAKPEEAKKHYAEALRGYQMFASWATSGGEGTARMLDVHRVQKKIAELDGK